MAPCCDPTGLCRVFDEKRAAADARDYRRKGLDRQERRIVDLLVTRGLKGATVLEIGGGIGALQIELVRAGAARAEGMEISPAYKVIARELARENGLDGRIAHRIGDFATEHTTVAPADAVIMHRVVCCYPDMPGLVRPAADRAQRWLVLTFPAWRWWIRAGLRAMNVLLSLMRISFRAYVHDPLAIEAIARSAGLRRTLSQRGLIWQLLALERP